MTQGARTAEELRASYRLPDEDEALLAECDVTAFRSSGPGGQHRNKTQTSIRLRHRPSGVVAIGRRERSQKKNLEDALGRLRRKLEALLVEPRKRVKTRPGAGARERRLREKRRRAEKKRERSSPIEF
jgi:protein subunit release factor B